MLCNRLRDSYRFDAVTSLFMTLNQLQDFSWPLKLLPLIGPYGLEFVQLPMHDFLRCCQPTKTSRYGMGMHLCTAVDLYGTAARNKMYRP